MNYKGYRTSYHATIPRNNRHEEVETISATEESQNEINDAASNSRSLGDQKQRRRRGDRSKGENKDTKTRIKKLFSKNLSNADEIVKPQNYGGAKI